MMGRRTAWRAVFGGSAAAHVINLFLAQAASAALLVNPDDARSWQDATVGTFAQLYYGVDNDTTRGQVIGSQLLDDGYFDATGYTGATLVRHNGNNPADVAYRYGVSIDQPNVDNGLYQSSYNYFYNRDVEPGDASFAANSIDQYWIQTDNVIGHTVFDLGFAASKAAIFNSVDHGPLPWESIESTVYLSNDLVNWTQAVTERVWLEGFYSDTSVLWDGFVYAVGTGTDATFRYASIIWGGPGALRTDGDNEINGVLGFRSYADLIQPTLPSAPVPEPESYAMLLAGLGLMGFMLRRRKQNLG